MGHKVLMTMMIAAILAGCGSDSPSSVPPPPAPVVPAEPLKGEPNLQGMWRSHCVPGKLEGLVATVGIGITQVTELTVKEDEVSERTIITSGSCKDADIEISSSGTYTSGETSRTGVKSIDMKLGIYKIKPVSEFGMRVLNLAKFCDIDEWKVGMVKNITVRESGGCLPTPRVQTVYSVENERLYFGFDREVPSEEERPTALRRDWYFTR